MHQFFLSLSRRDKYTIVARVKVVLNRCNEAKLEGAKYYVRQRNTNGRGQALNLELQSTKTNCVQQNIILAFTLSLK